MLTKKGWLRFKHAYYKNPYGYLTFWDYWSPKSITRGKGIFINGTANILTQERVLYGRIAFLRMWFKLYKI